MSTTAASNGSERMQATDAAVQQRIISIVLEGLDGVGKSTLAAALAKRLGAVSMRTPPECMEPFRSRFTSGGSDSVERKTFYMVGNYLAGHDMARVVSGGRCVVLDRYYASTQSYILGQRSPDQDLPPPGDAAYSWPPDLPRPHHMLLLTLPEEVRLTRRAARTAVAETDEEAKLRTQAALSERINEAYRRFGCVEVSAHGTTEEIVERILALVNR